MNWKSGEINRALFAEFRKKAEPDALVDLDEHVARELLQGGRERLLADLDAGLLDDVGDDGVVADEPIDGATDLGAPSSGAVIAAILFSLARQCQGDNGFSCDCYRRQLS